MAAAGRSVAVAAVVAAGAGSAPLALRAAEARLELGLLLVGDLGEEDRRDRDRMARRERGQLVGDGVGLGPGGVRAPPSASSTVAATRWG